ncbi:MULTISPECIES: tetratricopeptide repeat protein [unclassified Lysobacter]|uniref:tetratricopeptide repeat protein n=1 Tax=unclassified Lysobacter TaxID=2635362 RepID=UPI001BED0956|nr:MULTISPECIES: tetratricopeptide repeat protein [unclassified Lysobacter]MBT2747785.1 tetratricopeptide repeat protein [Lysobacter sp. ISL-42]MBT2751493.1 tetratricopeptide repeat protein [Lysobacter sp. ISL-50]MBT2778198.1 tetratricopeptide repeat protein [Lysobacter sp. ISL-54]MBT2782755.1 tetratricopeptide repeat protein [Lysobacter sp. ISL-52]
MAATRATIQAQAAKDPTGASLESLLAGEFALQSGKLNDAASAYLKAARAAGDVVLAERATSIALVAKQDTVAAEALGLWRKLGGKGHSLAAAEATLSLRRGDDRAALRQLNELMTAEPDTGWRQVLGVLTAGAKDQKQAGRLLEKIVDGGKIPQRNLMAWVAFGGLAQRLDQPKLTERIVSEVVKRFPGEPRVGLLRVSQLREDGKAEEASQLLATLLPLADTDTNLRALIAEQYEGLNDFQNVAAVLARGPQDEQTYALRASYLARAEDKPTLTKLYDELRADAAKPDPARRLLLGQLAEFLERNDEALNWYQGVPGGSQRSIARLRSANVLHKLKRSDEAYASLRAIQSDASADDDTRRDGYILEANLRADDKNVAGENDAFARGLAAFPDEPEILYARALSWERRDDVARAEADFRRILVAEPDSIAALNALGYTLADRTTRYQEAFELIERARTAEPDNAAIIDSYGWVLYRLGRVKEAETELRRALTMQKDAEIAAHLAELLWETGRKDEARKYFEQARKIDADNRSLQRALKKYGL